MVVEAGRAPSSDAVFEGDLDRPGSTTRPDANPGRCGCSGLDVVDRWKVGEGVFGRVREGRAQEVGAARKRRCVSFPLSSSCVLS